MKIPYNWLKEFLPINQFSPEEIAEILLSIGFEVANIIKPQTKFENIITASVKNIIPHPHANNLTVCTLNDGKRNYTVVCGAKNFNKEDIVPLALPGAKLPDGSYIKETIIRNISSYGMICSSKELGLDDQSGIMVLPKNIPIGVNVREIYPDLGDIVLDIEIPPNRPDCLSIIGIAKELSAKLSLSVKLPETHYEAFLKETPEYEISVEILSPELCKRYIAVGIYDLKVGESTLQVKLRLKNCGLRPINNVVDITNYVMLEFGHPMHVFDLDKLSGKKIIIRRANENESIIALDGKKYTLSSDMLLIADTNHAQALAGIIGAESSSVDFLTKNVLLESAIFQPQNIRRTRQKLNIITESSYRFERGTSWDTAEISSKRATRLIVNITGAKYVVRKEVSTESVQQKIITLRPQKVNSVLSTEYSKEDICEILTRLGMEIKPDEENLKVIVPSSRLDINEEIDLIEEVVRIKGFETVPQYLRIPQIPTYQIQNTFEVHQKIRQYLISLGFYESINYGFVLKDSIEKFQFSRIPVKIENPISKETEFLRLSIAQNLLENILHNLLEYNNIKLFEIGKVFYTDGNKINESCNLGIMFNTNDKETYDFFYLSNIVQNIIKTIFGLSSFEICNSKEKYFHPGKSAEIIYNNTKISDFGVLNPIVHPKISTDIYFAEIYLDALSEEQSATKVFVPFTTLPKSKRDISILVPEEIQWKEVEKEILSAKTDEFNIEFELIDIYHSKKIPKGKKSYTVSLYFSHKTHTLTVEEINKKVNEILDRLSKLKIFLRTPLT